jgi:hypothetical protein
MNKVLNSQDEPVQNFEICTLISKYNRKWNLRLWGYNLIQGSLQKLKNGLNQ